MFKIYNRRLSINANDRNEVILQVNNQFEIKKIALSEFDKDIYLGIKVEDIDLFNNDYIATICLKENENVFTLPDSIIIEPKKTIIIKVINNKATAINLSIALIGNEK